MNVKQTEKHDNEKSSCWRDTVGLLRFELDFKLKDNSNILLVTPQAWWRKEECLSKYWRI